MMKIASIQILHQVNTDERKPEDIKITRQSIIQNKELQNINYLSFLKSDCPCLRCLKSDCPCLTV